MKKIILSMGILSLLSIGSMAQISKDSATANKLEGLIIFVDSSPVLEYEYLGTVKATFGMDSQYTGVRDKLIRKAKKEFPQAEALIFNFKTGGTDRCDAIRFIE